MHLQLAHKFNVVSTHCPYLNVYISFPQNLLEGQKTFSGLKLTSSCRETWRVYVSSDIWVAAAVDYFHVLKSINQCWQNAFIVLLLTQHSIYCNLINAHCLRHIRGWHQFTFLSVDASINCDTVCIVCLFMHCHSAKNALKEAQKWTENISLWEKTEYERKSIGTKSI